MQWSKTHGKLPNPQDEFVFEAVNGEWEILFQNHLWIPQISIEIKECNVLQGLNYDIEVPCVVQWRTLWCSAPTSLDNDLLNDGVNLEKYDKSVQNTPRTCPLWKEYTPSFPFLEKQTVDDLSLLERVHAKFSLPGKTNS